MTARSVKSNVDRDSILSRWEAQWRAEDPSFDVQPLRENSAALDDATLAFLSLSSEARGRMQLTENEFETRFGARSGCALALALRDPDVAHVVAWSVCQSHDALAFDAFLSLLISPGAAWSGSAMTAAVFAVRVFERRHHLEAMGSESACETDVVRLPEAARDALFTLLVHERFDVREAASQALAYAFDPRLIEESGPIRDALLEHVLDPAVGPHAYQVFARAPDAKHTNPLRAHAAAYKAWWLLACLARQGETELAHAHFDALPALEQCRLADVLMRLAPRQRAFLLARLRDASAPLALREALLGLFGAHGYAGEVKQWSPILQRERERDDACILQAPPAEPREDDFRVFRHPEDGTWSIARVGSNIHLRIVSPDGEVSSRTRKAKSAGEAERNASALIENQLADGYVEVLARPPNG